MQAVSIREVGPRDGLQNEDRVLPAAARAELCRRLADAGLQRIEAVSFVRDDRVPAMADAEAVIREARATTSALLAALVLNERGYERALSAGADEVLYAFPVTESSALHNQGLTVADGRRLALALIERARDDGLPCAIGLSAAFGCAFEGAVECARVITLAEELLAAGAEELVLADSIGVAVPRQVREVAGALAGARLSFHFHNTRNTGYVNALAALEAGASGLDAAAGGLGGCPFMPGATGNIATEDLVYLLEGQGCETGVDLDRLRACGHWLAEQLSHPLPSLLSTAGDPCGVTRPRPVDR